MVNRGKIEVKKNILIGIREIENPSYSPSEIKMQVSKLYPNEVKDGKIKFIEIPDIESINYGRDVGYDVIEHKPPERIKEISGTKIRAENG